jgi:hypothetical protein
MRRERPDRCTLAGRASPLGRSLDLGPPVRRRPRPVAQAGDGKPRSGPGRHVVLSAHRVDLRRGGRRSGVREHPLAANPLRSGCRANEARGHHGGRGDRRWLSRVAAGEPNRRASRSRNRERAPVLQRSPLVGMARCEAIALVGFTLGFMGASLVVAGAFFVVALALMATKFPRIGTVIREIESATGGPETRDIARRPASSM